MSYQNLNQTPYPSRGERAAMTLASALADGARIALPPVTAFVVLAVAANAALSVARLFSRMGADSAQQALAAVASVGVLAALVGVLALARNANLKALGLLFTVLWLPITLALVGLETATASDIVSVPAALTESGRIAAGLLAGLALLPVVTLAVASKRPDGGNVRAALGYYVSNALKLVLLVATSGANVAFGLQRGVPLAVTAFVAVTLETAFVLALLRSNSGRLHAGALVVFGGALALVSVETLTVLSGLRALVQLAALGEAVYLLTPALALGYVVATALTDRKAAEPAPAQRDHSATDRETAAVVQNPTPTETDPEHGETLATIALNGHSANGAGHSDPKAGKRRR